MTHDLEHARIPDVHAWASGLGVSSESVALLLDSDVIDLHLDSFIWDRILGYDLHRRHEHAPLGRHFFHHVDFPRALEAGMTGGTWVITTNPFRSARGRERAFAENLATLKSRLADTAGRLEHVRTVADYRAARARGAHGAFLGIQGGNALDATPESVGVLADRSVVRVTLVHLTGSSLGATSAPSLGDDRLTSKGHAMIEALESMRVLVDLAHIGRRTFDEAVRAHDRSLPLIVTHTGIDAVHPHWRNVTDAQIRAIADTGGTVGIMLQSAFLGRGRVSVETFVDHVAHVVRLVGDDHVSLGSDFDGMISPPRDLTTPSTYPRIVDAMLRRGLSTETVRKFLGGNALRTIAAMRG